MKTLLLIRHAKTSWINPTASDHDRPLEERGIQDAEILSHFLNEHHLKPDILLASPALRTHHTAEIIAEHIHFPKDKIIYNENIYNAGVEDLLHILQALDSAYKTVFLVAHNPAITMLANYLGETHIASLQTAGACCIELLTDDWTEITTAEAKTLFEYHPPHDIS